MIPLLRSLRPEQWLKNGFVMAPLIFSGRWDDVDAVVRSFAAVLAFSFAASATYLVNDLVDREADRNHPGKRERPIAAGTVGLVTAVILACVLVVLAMTIAVALGSGFLVVLAGYLVLTLLYSAVLKLAVFVDVLVVGVGFVLRVVGGAAAIEVPVSRWILLCTFLLALYLVLGKRRTELVMLGEEAGDHRVVLGHYTLPMVDQAISVVLGATVLAYALYTAAPETVAKVGSEGLMATVPIVLYGLFRYLYLLHRHELGASPTRALLTDRPLLVCVLVWLAVAAAVVGMGSRP
ncbi:MAG: decaprenyl-phosphate phosphoribosyltransferase [Thermoanaerobaculales bacterium]|nr:decaprenyl-phosphate phosphoribosyltransferase [Thermoanaerobaculales bacterium]